LATSSEPPTPKPNHAAEIRHALRIGLAAVVCLLLAEWWNLGRASLAVWTTHMVMAQWTFSIFQKGIERIVGRGLGIVAGLVLGTVLQEAWLICLFAESLLLLVFFYLFFADRLAYTFLNAGLYLIVIVAIGHSDPHLLLPSAREMFLAVVLGVVVADMLMWLTGSESTLHIETGTAPLLPLRRDWLNHSGMLVVSSLLVVLLCHWLELPVETSIFSVFMVSVAPDVQAALRKGELRLLGALLAVAWAALTFIAVVRMPHLLMLTVMLFVGMFLAAYLARVGGSYAYAGVQMGLVVPLLVVVPLNEFGDLQAAWQRIQGILAAIFAMVLVGSVWPNVAAPSVATGGTATR
jgi:uncharacterized membrane protein YccC